MVSQMYLKLEDEKKMNKKNRRNSRNISERDVSA